MSSRKSKPCSHTSIHLDVSPNAARAGFKRPSSRERIRAATQDDRYPSRDALLTPLHLFNDAATFPAPLVLPDDDLDVEPDEAPQSVKEWREEEERNAVTRARKTIYLVSSPDISDEMAPMEDWARPVSSARQDQPAEADRLKMDDLAEYVGAFYHGMPIKLLSKTFTWRAWEYNTPSPSRRKPKYDGSPLPKSAPERLVGLGTPSGAMVGVRCRRSPDGVARMQVNLDDVLDALLENVPRDAYAVMMLLDMDMYEGDDDIFTGGRAYGGSRIAVTSSFRDQPSCSVDDGHRWPAAHCASYIDAACGQQHQNASPGRLGSTSGGPMGAAVQAAARVTRHEGRHHQYVEWLSRVAQTMTHELGHCMGLDHCVYYACVMQGCASSAEATRQPPYLCPVCLEKVAWGIAPLVGEWRKKDGARSEYVRKRYEAARAVCERWTGQEGGSVFWDGYKTWLRSLLEREVVVLDELDE
ncbi:hypothetical protein QQS21_000418 [Conoideocrella luteorostrata]|uniref:Archaemetzincin-2 n=1 Tax=Conoideocrella luteorostrata TaxID=1105319 RepID=A0AAJ0FZ74_9HYPO|nr:hypothetical protein QQS21_000418 [Conoideocrella luteorostrata]